MADLKTYRGNCHCGSFVYEIQVPEITSVGECNCSICSRKGYLWVFTGKENFQVVKGDVEDLSRYVFGSERMEHRFCGKCGTGLMARALVEDWPASMAIGINVHAIQGINTWTLTKKPFDGKAMGAPYEPHSHKGPFPEAEVDNGKMHTGSCHCGKLTIAVKVPPLDSTFPDKILECNCSICERNAYIWIYPTIPQVVLHSASASDIGYRSFASGLLNKTFCKTCGVPMTNQFRPESEGELDSLTDAQKEWIPMAKTMLPVNVRVLDGVDLEALPEIVRDDAKQWPPFYENP